MSRYANDLGSRAVLGFSQYQRQDLIGGRYGLLQISHDGEALGKTDTLRINPDFWVIFMWKRVMGSVVLNATAAAAVTTQLDADVRVYAHCGSPASEHAAITTANPLGVILINTNVTVLHAVCPLRLRAFCASLFTLLGLVTSCPKHMIDLVPYHRRKSR